MKDSAYIQDALEKACEKSQADVCILNWMRREQLQATVVDGIPGVSSQIVLSGIGCRSLIKGSWGFASSTDIEDMDEIMNTSETLAQYKTGASAVVKIPSYCRKWHPDIQGVATLETTDAFFELLKEAHQPLKEVPHILSSRIGIMAIRDERIITTSDGVSVEAVEPRILGSIAVVARSENKTCHYTEVIGGEYGLPTLKEAFSEAAERGARTALYRLCASSPPCGMGKVLLAGEVVGLLAHEAVGHAAEADIAKTGSFLSGRTGERITPSSVSIADDATLKTCFGTIGVDDEGVPGQKTDIIKKGILENFLHSRETAYEFHTDPTGNARAWLYSREPKVRMTNTFMAPGDAPFEELVEEVDNGFYLTGDEGGNATPDGTFFMITTLARKIENGKLTDTFYMGPVITGNALQILESIKAVGDESTFVMTPAICGKGGSAFVGRGGPAVVAELRMGS